MTTLPSNGNGAGVWDKTTPLRAVAQVIRKLKDGTYPTVPTTCFCGSEPNDTVLVERDRYMIPHRMVMCEQCLLIRANPRMTEEAYKEFYNNEYRAIYDGFDWGEKSEDDDHLFEVQAGQGIRLKEFFANLDEIVPKSIVDIGCDKGGFLKAFQVGGATVYGVEWCERSRKYCEAKGVPTFRSIDEFIEQGIKVDMVIMSDFVEHLTDLNEIYKLKKVLNPGGYIFIYTPGVLAMHPQHLFQNAHTYQFIGATLEAVMSRMGFVQTYLDERVNSLWKDSVVDEGYYMTTHLWWPTKWRVFIMEHLLQTEKRSLPPVRTHCKFGEAEMLDNLKTNLALHWPNFSDIKKTRSGGVVIVGAGPTVDGQLDKIKELVAEGNALIVIERMYPWCFAVGLKPDYVVALDGSENVGDGFTHIQPDTVHLICGTIHPKILLLLDKYKKYIWSGSSGHHPDASKLWRENGYETLVVVSTGGTVVLGSMFLSLILGFRNIHLFGFDLMVSPSGPEYARGVAGESVKRNYIEVCIDGEDVTTCTPYLAFAQQFFDMCETARQWGMMESIDVYGESLVNKMWQAADHEDFNGGKYMGPKVTETCQEKWVQA